MFEIVRSPDRPDVYTLLTQADGSKLVLKNGRIPFTTELRELQIAITNHFDFSGGTIEQINELIRDSEQPAPSASLSLKRAPAKPTFVYVMRNSRNGYHKIGFSTEPRFREKTLQSQEPEVSLLFAFPGTVEDEERLHDRFASKRLRGEWFNLTPEDVESIRRQGGAL